MVTMRVPLHCAMCACLDDAAAGNAARYARVHNQRYKGKRPLCPGFCEECARAGMTRQALRCNIWLKPWRVINA